MLAETDPYVYICHPQYVGFLLLLVGFLIQVVPIRCA